MVDIVTVFLNVFIHLDTNLLWFVTSWGNWIYPFLFAIIFAETGLVIMPFLPGDSLIFVAGTLSALKLLNLWWLFGIFLIAAILGDTVNYHIGKYLGPKLFDAHDNIFFKKKYLMRAKEFYDRKGGMTIFLARFIPIVRTFAPFVAGICKMDYLKFLYYNVFGALVWVSFSLFAGFFLGATQFVKDNFTLTLIIIMVVSCIPILFDHVKEKMHELKLKKLKPKSL
jgi:membrane-associated protein